jgi:hypothetical protein
MSFIFKHAFDELHNHNPPPTNPQYLVKTEGIATLDRLAYEMVTGDRTKRPVRLWKQFGTMKAIEERSWPWIDPEVLNLEELKVEGPMWPRDDGGIPYFTQLAALRYHYGLGVANHQQYVLNNLLSQYSFKGIYRTALEGMRYIIQNIMRFEIFKFLLNGFTVVRMRTIQSQIVNETTTLPSTQCDITKLGQSISEWEHVVSPLSFK